MENKGNVWRFKTITLWLSKGDENTKYSNQFSNHEKNVNTICKMPRNDGLKATCFFGDLTHLGINHFEEI